MFRTITFLLIAVFVGSFLAAQQEQETIRCYTMEMDAQLRANNPGMESLEEFERWMSVKRAELEADIASGRTTPAVITIPVVVHVIHNGDNVGSGENISQAQVNSQIDVLNEDFRRIMGTPGWNNDPVGADTEIEFCLAVVDPQGNVMPEPGIDRQDMGQASWGTNDVDNTLKPATSWDPINYFNMWTVRFSNGSLLGYAQFPNSSGLQGINANNGAGNTDGVVVGYQYFGRVGNVSFPYDEGRTATHEVGHSFGLRHIWGDANCGNDYCDDTPEQSGSSSGCPNTATCDGVNDMVENYMDYSNDACMNIFTLDQKSRIQTVMANSPRRASLILSNKCLHPNTPPSANFSADLQQACPGTTIQFTDNSLNTPTSWSWNFGDGGTSTQQNPSHTYNTIGLYNVSLTVTNAFGNDALTQNGYIDISTGALSIFWTETFENGVNGWTVDNPDNDDTWSIVTVAGNTPGTSAAGINLYNYNAAGERDGLISPILDFSNKGQVGMNFEHAHRRYSQNEQDSLIIYASTNGGNSWIRLWGASENGTGSFATNYTTQTNFVPGSADDWCTGGVILPCFSIDLSQFDNLANMRLKFETYNDYGNNIYVDNIEIYGTCTGGAVSIQENLANEIRVFPNPTIDKLYFDIPSDLAATEISLLDNLGRVVLNTSRDEVEANGFLDMSHLSEGLYFVKISHKSGTFSKKVLKMN